MLDFVELGKKLNVDRVVFSAISNWGTFGQQEYQDHAVQNPKHPEHQNLLSILEENIFESDQVDLGNLTSLYNNVNEIKKIREYISSHENSSKVTSTQKTIEPLAVNSEKRTSTIAFYLPQFHPIYENNKWWGKGFTEWTNTAKALPLFKGHYQPHIPADLGFYDLRVAETRKAQARMAKENGIDAFCYWHYWFGNGRRLLERPLEEVIKLGEPDFPFCLGWANQTWSGVWHGAPNKILMEQTYPGLEDYKSHFYSMLPAFRDERYFKFNGKLLFLIYNPAELPNAVEFTNFWRELAHKEALVGFHFVAHNQRTFQEFGCDSCVDNAPFINFQANSVQIEPYDVQKTPKVKYYTDFVNHMKNYKLEPNEHPLIVPNWDNTPRSGHLGYALHGSTPDLFSKHVEDSIKKVEHLPSRERLVFIKAWNEWAEGNHMEPDLKYGNQYLHAYKNRVFRR